MFQAITLKGVLLDRGMARFDDALSAADTEALHDCFVDQSRENDRAQKSAGADRAHRKLT